MKTLLTVNAQIPSSPGVYLENDTVYGGRIQEEGLFVSCSVAHN